MVKISVLNYITMGVEQDLGTSESSEPVEISSNEKALASWVPDAFYERYRDGTYEDCLREKWAIEGVLRNGFEIEDKSDLKRKVRLLDEIAHRKAQEYQRRGEPVPKVEERVFNFEEEIRERVCESLKIMNISSKIGIFRPSREKK